MPNYTFKYQIVDEDTDETIVGGSTFISESISQYGECESVDMEVGKAMRIFKKEKEGKTKEDYLNDDLTERTDDEMIFGGSMVKEI